VKKALGPGNISRACSRKFARKASEYKLAYILLHDDKGEEALMYADIEAMRKLVKTHRCALTSDRRFIETTN
jgi:hypothetical protein